MNRYEEIKKERDLQKKLHGAMKVRILIREWFRDNGFLEVETPSMVRTPGQEPYLVPFETMVQTDRGAEEAYFITSPEYSLKKLLAAGFPKVFELARCFRNNEPLEGFHNPEFTMLEWYRAGTDYRGIMEDVENMVYSVSEKLRPATDDLRLITDFRPPWERLSVKDAFARYASIDLEKEVGRPDFEDWFFKTFLTHIEQKLGMEKPTILYDYPASMASLARLKSDDSRYAERFEVYIKGLELANAFSELNDTHEQRRRLEKEQQLRRQLGKSVYPIDEEFLAALAEMPSCGGIALGVDRLAMLLLDAKSIREVLFFPYS